MIYFAVKKLKRENFVWCWGDTDKRDLGDHTFKAKSYNSTYIYYKNLFLSQIQDSLHKTNF